MIKKIISLLLIIIIVAIPLVIAQPEGDGPKVLADDEGHVMMGFDGEKDFCKELLTHKDDLVGFTLPSIIPYKDEVFHILYNSEKPFGTLILENHTIKDFSCELKDEATFNIYIKDDKTLKSFGESENPLNTYNDLVKSGDIRFEGVGFGKKVKGFFTNLTARIASWFI